jgi:hypothetical protein
MPGQFQKGVFKIMLSHSTGRWYRGGLALDVGKLYLAGFNLADEQLTTTPPQDYAARPRGGGSAPDGWLPDGSGEQLTLPGRFGSSNTGVLTLGPRPPK